MRFALFSALLAPAALGQPAGPDANTLVWWQAPSRVQAGGAVPEWVRPVAQDLAGPLIAATGEESSLGVIGRLALLGTVRGRWVTAEIMAAPEAPWVAPAETDPAPPPEKPAPKSGPGARARPGAAPKELPAAPAPAPPPPVASKPVERSAWVRIGVDSAAAGQELLEGVLGAVAGLTTEARVVEGIAAVRAALPPAETPVLWSIDDRRLIVATTERALIRASESDAEPDAPSDTLKDYRAILHETAEKRPTATPVLRVFANANAFRREFEKSFRDGRGAKVLGAWRLTNARAIAACIGITGQAGANADPALVTLDVAFTARSDAPGVARSVTITEDRLPANQADMKIAGAGAMVVAAHDPRAVMDWLVKTYRATLDDAAEKDFALAWRTWLGENRSGLADMGEQVEPIMAIGFASAADAKQAGGTIPFRLAVRASQDRQRVSRNLGAITRAAGSEEIPSQHAESLWTVPVQTPWVRGRVVWVDRKLGQTSVIAGALSIGEEDPIAALPKFEEQAPRR